MSDPAPVVFMSYTHALRHPVIIGHVAGWRLPWALSASQLGAVAAAAVTMLATKAVWAHLGGVGNMVLFCLVVGASGWVARHWRIEGRSPLRYAVSVAAVAVTPRRGVRNGRPIRRGRPIRDHSAPVVIRDRDRSHE